MANPIAENATKIIRTLFDVEQRVEKGETLSLEKPPTFEGKELAEWTGLKPSEINDAVQYLSDRSLIERMDWLGTDPFSFGEIELNSRGRFLFHELSPEESTQSTTGGASAIAIENTPPLPVGSPFGFVDQDWEYVQRRVRDRATLYVVFGFQFESKHYETAKLKANIEGEFTTAVREYNSRGGRSEISLGFKSLAASYGEHLFNQIARDIISADIAVFETSDLNPNVMIEMGVALTWGRRVLPIRKGGCPKPPTDISGQTWAEYTTNGSQFLSDDHPTKMLGMIERAIQKKFSA